MHITEEEAQRGRLSHLDWLLERAGDGDSDAFGEIYSIYRSDLTGYIFRRTNDSCISEDLSQQVFIKAWQNLHTYEHRGYFKAWLYRITRNHLVDHFRAQRPLLGIEGVEVPEPEETEPSLVREETYRDLHEALAALSTPYREVLVLRFILGLSAEETGARMDRSADAVRSLQVRALKTLRKRFDELDRAT